MKGDRGQSDWLSCADVQQLGRESAWNERPDSRAPEPSIRKQRYPEKGQKESSERVACSSGWDILGQTARYPGWHQRELTSKRADILGDRGWPGGERRDQWVSRT